MANVDRVARPVGAAYVVDRLTEVARVERIADYLGAYQPPRGSGSLLSDAATAVREVRELP